MAYTLGVARILAFVAMCVGVQGSSVASEIAGLNKEHLLRHEEISDYAEAVTITEGEPTAWCARKDDSDTHVKRCQVSKSNACCKKHWT